ncbi:MAG TPA: class I SAM-dependent methyltransferase [Chitinophagaceae bacterium]|nr:class I SAM-dependent methyltransferase [Chitinophagales bacterium]HRX93043.1 class I SAM-dependent methyltransferase [Chitinophagaceae bacterium]
MNDAWTERWNSRYSEEGFAYGTEPNYYFKTQLEKFPPGKLLLPAEGEGRNAVFAARLGWKVTAFDISAEGKNKALQLAAQNNVSIDYQIGKLEDMHFRAEQFDAIGLIYAHFPPAIKSSYHKAFDHFLRPGGMIIFEAFSKKHIEYIARNEKVGGPKDIGSLFSIEELKADFANYEILELAETELELKEGKYHDGLASVIRFIGRKK